MSWEILTTLENAFTAIGVPMYLVGIIILAALAIGFLILGLDIKYAIAFISPAILGFGTIGWFPIWIITIMWVFIAGMGLYSLYSLWKY